MSEQMPIDYVNAFVDSRSNGSLDESVVHSTVQDIPDTPPRTFHQWAETRTAAFA